MFLRYDGAVAKRNQDAIFLPTVLENERYAFECVAMIQCRNVSSKGFLEVSFSDLFVVIIIIIFVSHIKDKKPNFGLLRNRLKFINFQILRIISSTSSGA